MGSMTSSPTWKTTSVDGTADTVPRIAIQSASEHSLSLASAPDIRHIRSSGALFFFFFDMAMTPAAGEGAA
jgi:hypothetical protein